MTDGAEVGVVVVAYRSSDVIGGLLDSVAGACTRSTEVVVVDNSPDDDGLSDVVLARPGMRVILARDNPGYGGAVNRGVAALTGTPTWIVVANPDVRIDDGAIDVLIDAARRLDRPGALGPRIVDESGTTYPSARRIPSLRTGIGHSLFVRTWPDNPWTRRYRNDEQVTERETGWLSGAFLLLPRSAFDAVGGFDESYFMYFEDVDLGRRLTGAGLHNYYVPEARVLHYGSLSTRHAPREMIRAHHRSAYRFMASKYTAWYLWPLRVALRAGLWVRSRVTRG